MLDWSISYLEKGLRVGTLEPTQEKAQRDHRNVHKHPKGGCKEGRARLFPVVRSARTRSNGHKLKLMRLQLDIRKLFV